MVMLTVNMPVHVPSQALPGSSIDRRTTLPIVPTHMSTLLHSDVLSIGFRKEIFLMEEFGVRV